jgi:hypothetical protein
MDRSLAANRSIEESFMQADCFGAYRHLKLSRDDKGVLVAIHPNYALLASVIVAAEGATFQDVGHFAAMTR